MNIMSWKPAAWLAIGSSLLLASCGGGGSTTTTPPVKTYTLSIGSTNPASGVTVSVYPADNSGTASGTTPLTLTYNANTSVVINASATAGSNKFSSWTGCVSTTASCSTEMYGNTAITANYSLTAVAVSPNPATVTIGGTVGFTATVNGTLSTAVTWTVAAPSGSSLSPGTITTTGFYTTPYPAPPTVTVTATSTADATLSGSATVTISPLAAAAGPALSVDAGSQTHAISPYIYGMNYYNGASGSSDATAAAAISLPVDRWGGNEGTSYNYLFDIDAKASDWYFENYIDNSNPINTPSGAPNTSGFNTSVENDAAVGAKTIGTLPIIGWVPADNSNCSFSQKKYGAQQSSDPFRADCGNGVLLNGTKVVNDPTDTYYKVDPPTFDSTWVNYLVNKFGNAASGGVAIYELDNEPSWWDAVHIDAHPLPFTYDELTNTSIATAQAAKTADPTAEVSGPVMDNWTMYFYSKKDVESGWAAGPCYEVWSNPVDRKAHGGIPLLEYYLQQFAAASNTYGSRLLDYLDMHTYFLASSIGSNTPEDTGTQQARLNSTRVFWDPTYTDPSISQPNYTTDANYTTSCTTPLQAPQLIPMAKAWIAKDYPGTKLAFTEYNWGSQDTVNGALAQADILGIFGEYGLDMATIWGAPDPTSQLPGLIGYEVYRNYDGNKSMFGNMALTSTSVNQGQLSVYGALRTSDNAVTVVVINKTYGDLTSSLSLANLTPNGTTAKAFLYSNANLAAIVAQTPVTITPPAAGGTTSTISSYTFPAQSITLFVVPQ
jgi:hypothetical protein